MYHKEVLILRQQLDKSTNLNFFKPKTEKTKYVKDKDVFLYTQPKFNSEKKKEEIFVKNRARPWNSKKKIIEENVVISVIQLAVPYQC